MVQMNVSRTKLIDNLRSLLPPAWFGSTTPVLNAVLGGLAEGWQRIFTFLSYAIQQARISTATGGWLDLAALDFFADKIFRRAGESDLIFRHRIMIELLRCRCTRNSVGDYIAVLTGRAPDIFEPRNPGDTGCYGTSFEFSKASMAYGLLGRWGSECLPYQFFITVRRPIVVEGINISGWNESFGGFERGELTYLAGNMSSVQVTDKEIYHGITRSIPAGTIAWTAIQP